MAVCWMANGHKNCNNKYKKLLEIQSQSISIKKKEEYTHFTPEYINKLFGVEENKNSGDEMLEEKDDKPSFKEIFNSVIPKHLFEKPKKNHEYYKGKQKTITPGKESQTNDNTKSLTDFNKDNSFSLQITPKMTLVQRSKQEVATLKRTFTLKKKPKSRLYEKETISFSAKIVKKNLQSLQMVPNERIARPPSFIIKTRTSLEEIVATPVIRKIQERAQTMKPDKIFLPLKKFTIKTKNEVQSNKAEVRTPTADNLRTPTADNLRTPTADILEKSSANLHFKRNESMCCIYLIIWYYLILMKK